MATPYMALTLPTPSVSTGPTWASTLNTAITTIDAHDHTTGKGVQVPISGLNINADLPMTTSGTSYNITGVKALRLTSLLATPTAASDIGEIVNSGGNLYWMNSSGQAVQITSGSALSATSLGGISGLPSGTASASFGSATFTWRSATNVAATMDAGPVLIRDTAASANGITLTCPAGISAYSLTLPAALPGSNLPLSMSSAGVLTAATITASQVANNTLTRTQFASVGQQVSTSSGTFSNSGAIFVDVTNLSVTITTTGRPVMLLVQPDATTNKYDVTATSGSAVFAFDRGGSFIAQWFGGSNRAMFLLDPVGAGTYTYKFRVFPNSSSLSVNNAVLVAYEL